ncbi:complex I subunit 5 family protein [Imhoffiella purpurea]|uniref:Hydrogenase-4 component B / Formate hydrogenlyase subunit 3 n=1 Tax=Imhoffiella purpurea TaxID=1249627 RepID=W9VCH3_9GAMM|nr:proton-conducting transporter membrane subunit [Imhoffiella purpurea]EXJ13737.1 Hydrogenase-4 component B / Formate hydrogenlyase subunit 3 [Imhoffiella purpurea]
MDSLALAVALPLLAALLATVWPARATLLGLLGALATAAAALMVITEVWEHGQLSTALGGWDIPLGIALAADGLSAALLAMTALVGLAISLYAAAYFDGRQAMHFWPLWLLLWTALNGLFLAGDLFNLYVTLELLGLSAVALGALGGDRAAVAASLRYLLVSLLGSISYLLGVVLLYTAHGSLDLARVAAALQPGPVAAAAMTLMIGGLTMKAALFPLHFWLPPAHASAPAPVSAALSALVVKAAVYLILRLWLDLFAPLVTTGAAMLLGGLGAAAVIWGSWRALHAERLKLLAAYSTVAQIGYLFLFPPLFQATPPGPGRDDLLAALVLMILTHGFAKSALFLAVGVIQKRSGHDRIAELGGTAQRLPATTFTLGLAGIALIGLPPSGSFTGKWLLLNGAFASGQWGWILVILTGTLMTAAYVFRVLSRAFNLEPTPPGFVTDARTELPALLLAAIAAIGLGLAAAPLWPLLGGGEDGT